MIDFVVVSTVADSLGLQSGQLLEPGTIAEHWAPYRPPPVAVAEQRQFPRILEIGSLDVNGSMRTYDFIGAHQGIARPTWPAMVGCREYVGIDLGPGPGVDIEMDAHMLALPDESFDLVLCLNMLEHDTDPGATMREAARVLAPDGLFLLACPDPLTPPHVDLGGYSDHYVAITRPMMQEWLTAAGFAYELEQIHGDSGEFFVKGKRRE